jgi:hypothetical protein
MITLTEIFAIFIIHWIADFVLQTDKQAKGKSKNWYPLIEHTLVYSTVWFVLGAFLCAFDIKYLPMLGLFFIITFISHTITDYFTSRLNAKLWAKGDVHKFFISVGFDQVLHYIQLFLTYYYLKQP